MRGSAKEDAFSVFGGAMGGAWGRYNAGTATPEDLEAIGTDKQRVKYAREAVRRAEKVLAYAQHNVDRIPASESRSGEAQEARHYLQAVKDEMRYVATAGSNRDDGPIIRMRANADECVAFAKLTLLP
jgi:hypothetical protein